VEESADFARLSDNGSGRFAGTEPVWNFLPGFWGELL
jgi:hypothetical protein